MDQSFVGDASMRRVSNTYEDALDKRVVSQIRDHQLRLDPRAVSCAQPTRQYLGIQRIRRTRVDGGDRRGIIRLDEVGEREPVQLRQVDPEQRAQGAVGNRHLTRRICHEDRSNGVFDYGLPDAAFTNAMHLDMTTIGRSGRRVK